MRMPATLNLLNTLVTTPVAETTYTVVSGLARAKSIGLQCSFNYGAGGTSCSVYVQTSFDGGITFCDVANFTFTTNSANSYYNISGLTPVTQQATLGSGLLGANTCIDGIVGDQWRVLLSSTGTYSSNTYLQVFAVARD